MSENTMWKPTRLTYRTTGDAAERIRRLVGRVENEHMSALAMFYEVVSNSRESEMDDRTRICGSLLLKDLQSTEAKYRPEYERLVKMAEMSRISE